MLFKETSLDDPDKTPPSLLAADWPGADMMIWMGCQNTCKMVSMTKIYVFRMWRGCLMITSIVS